MAGRMEDGHAHVAHLVVLAIFDGDVGEAHLGRLVEQHRGAGDPREMPGSGEVVGLDVGLEHVRDAHVLLRGGLEVGLDVGLWIHHSAAPCPPSAEEIARAAGLGREELTEDHGRGLLFV